MQWNDPYISLFSVCVVLIKMNSLKGTAQRAGSKKSWGNSFITNLLMRPINTTTYTHAHPLVAWRSSLSSLAISSNRQLVPWKGTEGMAFHCLNCQMQSTAAVRQSEPPRSDSSGRILLHPLPFVGLKIVCNRPPFVYTIRQWLIMSAIQSGGTR